MSLMKHLRYLWIIGMLLTCIHIPIYAQDTIPSYQGNPYVEVDNNVPDFDDSLKKSEVYTDFQSLDSKGRCQSVLAEVGMESMPTEKRGSIGMIRPSGWHLVKYESVDGKYLYNRCHLIGYQLCGVNKDRRNLITGTRYFNVEGMLPFENQVADFIESTEYHVLYRATPIFEGDNLLASGVELEAESVEDDGSGLSFHVFCFNVQPGITIDYSNGNSWEEVSQEVTREIPQNQEADYILNTNSDIFHYPTCKSVSMMSEHNKEYYTGSREDLIQRGFRPCKNCSP